MTDNIAYGQSLKFADSQGAVFITHLSRRHLLLTAYGVYTLPQVHFICGECDRAISEAGQLTFYADARRARVSSAQARERVAAYMNSHKAQIVASHVLFSSRMASMARRAIEHDDERRLAYVRHHP